MSERITAANLDEVIKRNEVIEEQMKQSASLIWSKYNPMQINSPIQLALQILRPYGLIQLPIDNRYLSGAIFVRDGKRIPLINTALPRANQYFTVWHEIYHLLFDEVSFDHLIESEILMEERKAEHFAALMLLGNLMPYFEGLKDMEFQAKAFQCMALRIFSLFVSKVVCMGVMPSPRSSIQGRRFRDGSSNRQDKILPEAAYSHFHPEREPDETHHAGISDSRWHSRNWHFYLRCVLELPRYTPPS